MMIQLTSFTLFCVLAITFASPILDEFDEFDGSLALNNKLSGRIVGGSDAEAGSIPYQVSLQKNNRHFCGGSILNSKWILSAGHCFQDRSVHGKIVVTGTTNLLEGGQRYKMRKVVVHPQFNIMKLANDLALINIEGTIPFTSTVKTISLPTYDIFQGNQKVIASGWGRIKANGKVPTRLQYLVSQIYDHNKCKQFNKLVTNKNICTFTKRGEGMCNGDSGGPVVAGEYQVGIVSWGNPCANGYPDVHTRVYSFVDWIKSHIDANE